MAGWKVDVPLALEAVLKQEHRPLAWIGEGLAVPETFPPVTATRGAARAEVEVIVTKGRARARKVSIETEAASGVTAALLRDVPVRQIVAVAVRGLLMKVVVGDKSTNLEPVTKATEDEIDAVQRAVGYVEAPR
jgi:hypothetical protein